MLRKPTDENANRIDGIELLDRVFGQYVDHAGSETAIGNHGDFLLFRVDIEGLLLEDDLRVAAEVREVYSSLHGKLRQLVVEIVGDRTHHRVRFAHQRQYCFLVADVEWREDQPFARMWSEKLRKVAGMQIGQSDFLYFRILKQIIGTRGA